MRKFSILLISLGLIWSCSNDDDNPTGGGGGGTIPQATVEPTDVNQVSTEMGATNTAWVPQTGAAPASSGSLTQSSSANGDTIPSTNGLDVAVDIEVTSGDAGAIVFAIEGSNTHYEVPSDPDGRVGLIRGDSKKNPFNARLVKKEGNNERNPNGYLFVFTIPSSIKPGNFCVKFAVTNANGDVSNYVTFCIQIQQRGGAGVGNLTSKWWKVDRQEYIENGVVMETYNFGVEECDTFPYFLICDPITGDGMEVDVVECSNDNVYLRFLSNGESMIENDYSYEYLDWDNSTCTNVVLLTERDNYVEDGGWSYNNTTKEFNLTINGYYDEDGFYEPPYTIQLFVISQSQNQIVLSFIDPDFQIPGFEVLLYLVPK